MTTWQSAHEKFLGLVKAIRRGEVKVPDVVNVGLMADAMVAMLSTLPIAQPTNPHDLSMICECITTAYLAGYAQGAEDTRTDILNYPSLKTE